MRFAGARVLTDRHGNNVSVTEGYLTTDSSLVGGVLMDRMGLVISEGIKPSNTSKLLKKWMDTHLNNQVYEVCTNHMHTHAHTHPQYIHTHTYTHACSHSQVDVRGNHTAVVRFQPGGLESILASNQSYELSGRPLHIHQAHLVWLPFVLPVSRSPLTTSTFTL